MKRILLLGMALSGLQLTFAYDWDDIPVPATLYDSAQWQLLDVSDDFNYDAPANANVDTLGDKWINFYHNAWTGPAPTVWKRDHVFVADGYFQIKADRTAGETVTVNSQTLATTNLGCATSTQTVGYPVFVETSVKITNSVLASDVWMLSSDDTQEIDICEAYGSDRYTNAYFSPYRLHLSHHVFIRSPFADWQPSDAGSFYTDGSTVWREDFHRIGVYWRDPWHLEYYVDGQLVRERDGRNQIDPLNYTSGSGLSKDLNIILNTEDQTWRATAGLTPTDTELEDTVAHTFKIDWVRAYQAIGDNLAITDRNANQVKLYYHPDVNHIGVTSDIEIQTIQLYHLSGTLAKQVDVHSSSYGFYLDGFKSGLYIMKVTTVDGKQSIHKVIAM